MLIYKYLSFHWKKGLDKSKSFYIEKTRANTVVDCWMTKSRTLIFQPIKNNSIGTLNFQKKNPVCIGLVYSILVLLFSGWAGYNPSALTSIKQERYLHYTHRRCGWAYLYKFFFLFASKVV